MPQVHLWYTNAHRGRGEVRSKEQSVAPARRQCRQSSYRRLAQHGAPSAACTLRSFVETVPISGQTASMSSSHNHVVYGGRSTNCSAEAEPLTPPTSMQLLYTDISTTRSPASAPPLLPRTCRHSLVRLQVICSDRFRSSRPLMWSSLCERFPTSIAQQIHYQLG